jgi:hypothetical protein
MKKDQKKDMDSKLVERLAKSKETAFHRFPLLFAMLAAFGIVITNNGIQGLINKIPWLDNNPFVTLLVGVVILLFTGTLYKKL